MHFDLRVILWALQYLDHNEVLPANCNYISTTSEIRSYTLTLSKAQRTRGLTVLTQVTSLVHNTRSYTNLDQIQLQNLDQASTSKSQPDIRIPTKLKLKNLQNLEQDLTS